MATVTKQTASAPNIATTDHVVGRKARGRIETDPSGMGEERIVTLAMTGRLAKAGRDAIRAQRRKGLAVTFKKGNRVIKQHADGREEVIATVTAPPFTLPQGVAIIKR